MLHFCRSPDKDWLRRKLARVGDDEPYLDRDGKISFRTPAWVIEFRTEKKNARRSWPSVRTFAFENARFISVSVFSLAWVLFIGLNNMNVDRWGVIGFALLSLLPLKSKP